MTIGVPWIVGKGVASSSRSESAIPWGKLVPLDTGKQGNYNNAYCDKIHLVLVEIQLLAQTEVFDLCFPCHASPPPYSIEHSDQYWPFFPFVQ
jgi:hypothetical protein